jgi:beta-N-acetylhexosaminidase
VAYDGLTDGLPSTLSAAILRDLLRLELGFDGLLVTDALDMRALVDHHSIPDACMISISAGADVVMPLDRQPVALGALTAAIGAGAVPEARVTDALERIATLDARLNATDARRPSALPNADHLELARIVARRSLTLLEGHDLLPLDPGTSLAVIEFASRRPSPVEDEAPGTATVGAALGRHFNRVREVVVDGASDMAAGERAAFDAAAGAEFVILATRDAYLWPEEQALIGRLVMTDRPTMLIALRNPYDLQALPPTSAAAAAYADVPVTLDALADALAGRQGWPGVLPMQLDPHRSAEVPAGLAESRTS